MWPTEVEREDKSRFTRYIDVLPLRGTYSFRSMLIDGKNEHGKPKVLAVSKPFLFGMDVIVSSDTKIDPCEDSVDKNRIGGSTAFCSKLRRYKSRGHRGPRLFYN